MQRLEIAHQMVKKVGLEGEKNATSGSFPVVNVSGWGLPRVGGKSPAVITRRTVWCAGRFTRDQMQTLLLKLWQETGKRCC